MLKFKNKVEQITATNEVGDYRIDYTFQMKEGAIIGGINANATDADGRHVKNMSTSDAVNFYGNTNEILTDDLAELHTQMKADLIELLNNTNDYLS